MIFRDRAFIFLDSIDSTNNYAANLLKSAKPPEGTVITALEQTEGRGQRGSQWQSAKGDNLLCSIIVYPSFLRSDESFLLSQIASLAVKDTIEEFVPYDVWIKWPNDILVSGMKTSGILIEFNWSLQNIQSAIIGIGINANQKDFDHPAASSVIHFSGQYNSPQQLLEVLIRHFDRRYEQLRSRFYTYIRNEYLSCLFGRDAFYPYLFLGKPVSARVTDVEHSGKLILEEASGDIIKADFKEISLVF